jgi:hypothetical protein
VDREERWKKTATPDKNRAVWIIAEILGQAGGERKVSMP